MDSLQLEEMDLFGGEPLDGSGFENEQPETELQEPGE